MACTFKERTLFNKLTQPIGYEDQIFTEKFFHTLVKEPAMDLPGGKLYALMNFGKKLPYYDNYYVERYSSYKVTHDWRELQSLDTQVDFRHTDVKVGWRKQKCRITYSSSWSFYPRSQRNHPDETSWQMQTEANLFAFLQSFKIHDTYKMLKIFRGTEAEIKGIIGATAKCNYFDEIVKQIESKTGDAVDGRMFYRSLQEIYNNAKDAPAGQNTTRNPLAIKSDGTYATSTSDVEQFKAKEDPTKMILECVNKIVFSNEITASSSTKKFIEAIAEDDDKKIIGLIEKTKEVIKEILAYPRTQYNLAHNASDVTKCSEEAKTECDKVKKFGVEFMNCCCTNGDDGDKCCFCELPKIKKASNLRIIVNPMTMQKIDAIAALCPEFRGFEFTSENFYGIQIVEDIVYPEGKLHLYEIGAIEFMERYNQENNAQYDVPDILKTKIRHIEQEIILRFNKVCLSIKKS